MENEISAYVAYGIAAKKITKKAQKTRVKRLTNRNATQAGKNGPKQKNRADSRNNGVPEKKQNGYLQKPKAGKMSSSSTDSSSTSPYSSSSYDTNSSGDNNNNNSSYSEHISDSSNLSKGSGVSTSQASASSSSSSNSSSSSSSSSVSNSQARASSGVSSSKPSGSSSINGSGDSSSDTYAQLQGMASSSKARGKKHQKVEDVDDDFTSDYDGENSSCDCVNGVNGEAESDSDEQFSVEYTLSTQSSSSSSSSYDDPSPVKIKPVAARSAGKRSEDNNRSDVPAAAKQQKSRAAAQGTQNKQDKGGKTAAPSCPLPSKNKVVKSCLLPNKEAAKPSQKSCRLSSKESATKTTAKSCRLSRSPANKMAAKMAAELSAQPRKKTAAQEKKEAEVRSKAKINEPRLEIGMKKPSSAVHVQSSIDEGKRMLHWLLNPMTSDCFFEQYWERNACQLKRKQPNYFSQLISFKMIDEMLINNHLEFTTNIDVTSYTNGVRETLNPDGRAMPPAIWGYYGDGCSIRILNPSTYLSKLRQLCATMQEFFHCLVGANVYLTPPNSQGFAPHYDDIEAFVLQVEGRKRWRLYAPPQASDVLALTSSGNYKQEELSEPLFDAILEPGDILYFPRGTVHQAVTEEQSHSLHITLSVYQNQAYANLLETLMPTVLQRAVKHHLTLRRGLPLHIWQHLGLARGEEKSELRDQLLLNIKRLVQQYLMPTDAQIDAAVDQLAKRFQHEALPPCIKPEEYVRTVFGSRSERDELGQCLCDYELDETTSVRLLRANIMRLVAEGSSLRLYYYVDNALEYCKYEANFMEIQPSEAAAVEALMSTYPDYIKIGKLPLQTAERRVEVATALWERGLLMTQKPFK